MWTKSQTLDHLNYDKSTGKFTFKDGKPAGANIKGYALPKQIPKQSQSALDDSNTS